MKLDEVDNNAMTRGARSKTEFTIDSSATAFMILSGKLYSNKVAAIIRELSTNAIDSHIDAGTLDKPFYVQIPTHLDHTFRIRDYGTGMSQETIQSLYTTYFRSNKNTDNKKTGAFGLGSKSPFSYAKSFTVTSYFNGEKSMWICMVGQEGTPEINLMAATKTDEPNGVEIQFAVKVNDVQQWQDEANNIYKWFKYRPESNIKLANVEFSRDGGWWKLMNRDRYNYGVNGVVVMGNVSYPVPHWKDIIIYCEIGDVDITPNREQLEMTPKTKVNLDRLYSKAKLEINKVLVDEFDKCPNKYEAIRRHNDIIENVPQEHRLSAYKYKGQTISAHMKYPKGTQLITLHNGKCRKNDYQGEQRVEPNAKLCIADSSYHMLRIKNYLNANSAYEIILFDKDEIQAWLDDLGLTMKDVITTSSLPKPVISRASGVKKEAYTYDAIINGNKSIYEVDDELFEDGGVYIEMKGGQPVMSDYWSVQEALSVIKNHDPILLINQVQISKFKKSPEWKEFDAANLVSLLTKAISSNQELYDTLMSDDWRIEIGGIYNRLFGLVKEFKKPELVTFVDKISKIRVKNPVRYAQHNKYLSEATQKLFAANPLVAEYNAIQAKYPVLKLLEHVYERPEAYRLMASLA